MSGFGPFGRTLPPKVGPRHVPTDDVAIGVDATGRAVHIPRGHTMIVGDPRTLVTTAVRTVALHHARFPATRFHIYEPDGYWELAAMQGLAHRFITTAGHGGRTARVVIDDLTELAAEIDRRAKVLAKLNADIAAAGLDLLHIASIPALHRLLPTALPRKLLAAGIDVDLTGLARHVVVIGDAIRWVHSDDDGQAFTDALVRVAIRGRAAGVSLVLGVRSPYLGYLPIDLIDAMETRVALRLRDPEHADRVLGPTARDTGADATDLGDSARGVCWIADNPAGAAEPTAYRQAQIYATDPYLFKADCQRLARTRRRENRLTGDALAANSRGGRR
ncbi:hypothetical protein ACXC9Q_18725 [Kribbella sp. CWNU-51]